MEKKTRKKSQKKTYDEKIDCHKKESGGFTLVELLAVIAILSLVVSITMYSIII